MEKKARREEIYQGKVIHVVRDDVLLDDGKMAIREVVKHKGGVCVALKDPDDGKFFMVRQYRYCFKRKMLEFCAGKLEKDEEPLAAIKRECEEELGYQAKKIQYLGEMIPTCGYSTEIIYLYYAEMGEAVGQHLDDDESIEIRKYSAKEIKDMVRNGTIKDGKTICLLYHVMMEGLDD